MARGVLLPLVACILAGACGGNLGSLESGQHDGGSGAGGTEAGTSGGGAGGVVAGGTTGASGSAGTGGSAGTAGTSGMAGAAGTAGASAGGAGGTGAVDCSKQPVVFPDFNRSCTSDSECAAETHQVDCCGTMVITGVGQSETVAYTAAEKLCESQYPACGCAAQQTRTDSGQTVTDPSKVRAVCQKGICTTYLP